MARARAVRDSEAPSEPARDTWQRLSGLRPILFGLAALVALAAAGSFILGMHGLRGEAFGSDPVAARAGLVNRLAATLRDASDELARRSDDAGFRAELDRGALGEANARLARDWQGVIETAVEPGRVEAGVVGAGERADYTRLSLVAEASVSGEVSIAPVGQGAEQRVGIARRIDDASGRPLAVAVAEFPLGLLTDPIVGTAIGEALIELRIGAETLFSHGEPALRKVATPLAVPGSPFSLTLGQPTRTFGMAPVFGVGLGIVLAVCAVLLFGIGRRAARAAGGQHGDATLAEALVAGGSEPASGRRPGPPRPAPAREPEKTEAESEAAHGAERVRQASGVLSVDRSIFRAYDIRGLLGKTLDAGIARLIGQAVGSLLREQDLREIVVGRDGRLSGPELTKALIEGLRSTGCDVVDIGVAPTPLVYFASHQLHTGSCVAVTGSHNPPDYNGFKIVVGGHTLSGEAISGLYERIAENRLLTDAPGGLQQINLGSDYVERIASDVQLERRLKVVVDCGNGVAGALVPEVMEAIGADFSGLYCEVDGSFPNHHPDPSEPVNLADLITSVRRTGADLGLAFDGDGDRLGVVSGSGRIVYADRVLMLFAQDVLSRNPGAVVIYDVKCSGHLAGQILRHGGSPIMWKSGHSLMKAKMRETDAELAGEMSGHFFFRERWYGFDDAIYAAARLLEILAADDRDPEEVFAELPDSVSTPELKLPMAEGEHFVLLERFREKARFEGAKVIAIDGVRADWPDGWGLVRASNTTPSLVLRFEADSETAMARIQNHFREQLLAVQPDLSLPF